MSTKLSAQTKRRALRRLGTGALILCLSGTMLYTSNKALTITEAYRNDIKTLNEELIDARDELDRLKSKLELYTDPIQYRTAAAPIYNIPLSEELQQYTYDTCVAYGIEKHYELVLAVMWQESDFEPALVSTNNNGSSDHGIMQINSINHTTLQNKLHIVDITDVRNNIECGVYILSTLLYEYNDVDKALMAYNMGRTGAAAQWERGNYESNYSMSVKDKIQDIYSNII